MANTFSTLKDGDIVRLMLESFHNQSTLLKTIDRQHDSDFGQEGHKNAGYILIREPNEFTVGTSEVVNVQPIENRTQQMVLSTRRNIAVGITSYERKMSADNFQKEVANPAMQRLVAEVEYTILNDAYKYVPNYIGTPGTTPSTIAALNNARARLNWNLAPTGDRHVLLDPDSSAAVTNGVATYTNPNGQVSGGFEDGYLMRTGGFKWWETPMVPSHTNGTRSDTSPSTSLAVDVVSGTAAIVVRGLNGLTYEQGDVFTIDGVYDVNQETKATYDHLKQFVVKTDTTCSTAGTSVPVIPTPYTSGAHQNCYHATWTGSTTINNLDTGGSGASSSTFNQPLAYHKNWLTVAFASLPEPYDGKFAQATFENISMRMWQSSEIINDKHITRFDVVFGWLVQRPEWCIRVRG